MKYIDPLIDVYTLVDGKLPLDNYLQWQVAFDNQFYF